MLHSSFTTSCLDIPALLVVICILLFLHTTTGSSTITILIMTNGRCDDDEVMMIVDGDNNCNNHYCGGCIQVDLSPLLSPHRVIRLTRTIRIIDDGSSKSRERVSKCLCLVITSLLLSKYIDNRRFIRFDLRMKSHCQKWMYRTCTFGLT